MRVTRRGAAALFSSAAILGLIGRPARAGDPVDAAIVLAADVSRSIDDEEFGLQRRGYAEAVASARVMEAIRSGPHAAIALCFVEWAGESEQRIVVDWATIKTDADASRFAAALSAAPRAFVGRTAIGTAIDFSMGVLGESGIAADRRVIDVSGDGTSNQGRFVAEARDAALKSGVVINGLAIFNRRAAAMGGYLALHTNPSGGLAKYYHDNVIGGPGAFVLPIDDFKSFGEAMIRKLVSEIARAYPLAPRSGERVAAKPPGEGLR